MLKVMPMIVYFQNLKVKARINVAPKIAKYEKIIQGYGYR